MANAPRNQDSFVKDRNASKENDALNAFWSKSAAHHADANSVFQEDASMIRCK